MPTLTLLACPAALKGNFLTVAVMSRLATKAVEIGTVDDIRAALADFAATTAHLGEAAKRVMGSDADAGATIGIQCSCYLATGTGRAPKGYKQMPTAERETFIPIPTRAGGSPPALGGLNG